ncbi:hypothetical protein B0T16DRAFT_463446 [Cercophora newfieldiana]|uniref:F-box domain-containing protein n=1 Tax=Cercophora newfieldiana TaxID=92897 RepID=A0AA39XT87_9PEZI|nr:hypothetical protein B0T16DRAFT_463446 [Cercophora newfieldiana]
MASNYFQVVLNHWHPINTTSMAPNPFGNEVSNVAIMVREAVAFPLLELPNETVAEVVKAADFKTIAKLRLTCRHLNNIALPILAKTPEFMTRSIMVSIVSIRAIYAIANHNCLGRHLTTLKVGVNHLVDPSKIQSWGFKGVKQTVTPFKTDVWEKQEGLSKRSIFEAMIYCVLVKCTNLKTIEISGSPPDRGQKALEHWDAPFGARTIDQAINQNVVTNFEFDCYEEENRDYARRVVYDVILAMAKFGAKAGRTPPDLVIQIGKAASCPFNITPTALVPYADMKLNIPNSFANLRAFLRENPLKVQSLVLSLGFRTGVWWRNWSADLCSFITLFANLRELTITVSSQGRSHFPGLSQGLRVPHLRKLSLSHFIADSPGLIAALLHAHRNTLEEVHLSHFKLRASNTEWIRFAVALRTVGIKKLGLSNCSGVGGKLRFRDVWNVVPGKDSWK